MIIFTPVFIIRKGLLKSCGICKRVVTKLHWNRLSGNDLPQEYVERGRHGNTYAVEDDVSPSLDGVIHPEIYLNGCTGFHVAHYIIQ